MWAGTDEASKSDRLRVTWLDSGHHVHTQRASYLMGTESEAVEAWSC
jgi:hypothetical protein